MLKTLEPSFKGAVFRYASIVSYNNHINQHTFSLKILNEAFLTNQFVFYFTKNFYLVDEINDKISQFKSSGLMKHWRSKYISSIKKAKESQTSMTLRHLSGVFELLIYGWIAASSVFVIELIFNYARRF